MDKLKIYAMPIAALLILLAYWFVVRPMLANQTTDSTAETKK